MRSMSGLRRKGRFSTGATVDNMNLHRGTDAAVEGVIILSSSCDLLYLSPGATRLIRPLATCPTENPSGLTLPPLLRKIGQEVRHQLQASLKQGNGLTCNVTRILASSEGTLFVRGLGVPNRQDGEFLTTLVVSTSPVQLPLSHGVCDEPCNQNPGFPASQNPGPTARRTDAVTEDPGSRP
jgi:hypothetical protein